MRRKVIALLELESVGGAGLPYAYVMNWKVCFYSEGTCTQIFMV